MNTQLPPPQQSHVIELLKKISTRDHIRLPSMTIDPESGQVNYDCGTTFALSNRLIDAPLQRPDGRPLSSASLKILDIAIAAFSPHLHAIRKHAYECYINRAPLLTPEDKTHEISQNLEHAQELLNADFSSVTSRTVRLATSDIARFSREISGSSLNRRSGSKTNTTHIADAVMALKSVSVSIKRSSASGEYMATQMRVFDHVRVGLNPSDRVKDVYLTFSLSFLREILGIADYTRLNLVHYRRLANSYAIRAYRLLISRAMRSKMRENPEHHYQVRFSLENWRRYLDLSPRTEYRIGTREELIEWAKKPSRKMYNDGVFTHSIFLTDARVCLHERLLNQSPVFNSLNDDERAICAEACMQISESMQSGSKLSEARERLSDQSILVYQSLPYAMPAKFKQEILDKMITNHINEFQEGGIKILAVNPYKCGRTISGFTVVFTANQQAFNSIASSDEAAMSKLFKSNDDEQNQIEETSRQPTSSGDVPLEAVNSRSTNYDDVSLAVDSQKTAKAKGQADLIKLSDDFPF